MPTEVDSDDGSGQPHRAGQTDNGDGPTHDQPRGLRSSKVGATGSEPSGRVLDFVRPHGGTGLGDGPAARAVMTRLANLSVRITADNQEHALLLRRLLARAEGIRVIEDGTTARRPGGGRRTLAADATLLATDLEPRALLALVGVRVKQAGVGALLVTTEQTDLALDVAAIAAGAADLLEVEELDTQRLQRAIRLAVARSLLRASGS